MTVRVKFCIGILLAAFAATCWGCGVQDPEQPAVGSISVNANRDDDKPVLAPGKMAPANPK